MILMEEEEQDYDTRTIGNSIVRDQLQKFCGRNQSTRKWMCLPGERFDDIPAACNEATSKADTNTVLIINASMNDVMNTRSEELLGEIQKTDSTV